MEEYKFLSDYLESEYTVRTEQAGMRADLFLAMNVEFFSRTRIKNKIQDGEITVNDRPLISSYRVKPGDVFKVTWRRVDDRPPPPPIDIVYDDAWFVAVNKPAAMPVHPSGRKQAGTLIQAVHAHFHDQIMASLATGEGDFYPRLVNRLDNFTSGVTLLAKGKKIFIAIQEVQVRREIDKRYLCLVEGRLEPSEGMIDLPIGKALNTLITVKQGVRPDGFPSVTHYKVREYLNGHTLVEAEPVTGRQHQLRVHFAHLGHPVWGDLIYKDEARFFKYYEQDFALDGLPPRHGLHAEYLAFPHPFTRMRLEITAPPPADFTAIVDSLR
ncbi:MAG: RluA family pseudouridine synthase [Planctomycetota bacterium]